MNGNGEETTGPQPTVARCKFRCESVTDYGSAFEVKLQSQYDEKLASEDRAFSKATPNGVMSAQINNPALVGFFQPGRSYYIDVSQV